MACLVDSDAALLVGGHHLRGLFESADDAVHGVEEVLLAHVAAVVAGGDECRLVAHVGDVCTREARRLPREHIHVEVVGELERGEVHLENCHALREFGQVHVDLAVEASGTEQGWVENFHAVGGCEDNHA